MNTYETLLRLVKKWRRYFTIPAPLTFDQLTDAVKTGNVSAKGAVYDMLGMLDLGSPKIIETIVLELTKPEKEEELRRVMVIAMCLKADGVFALKYDEIVLNVAAGPDGLTPLQRMIFANEDVLRAVGANAFADAAKTTHAVGRDGAIYTPTTVPGTERSPEQAQARVALIRDALRETNFEQFAEVLPRLMASEMAAQPQERKP
jgi:hypothetical protein